MTIIKESLKKVFLSLEPLFYLDRNRYTRLLDKDFRGANEFDPAQLSFDGFRSDKMAMRKDVANVSSDLKKAQNKYLHERMLKYDKD